MNHESEHPSPEAYKRAVVRAIAASPIGMRALARKSGLGVATIHSYVKGSALPRIDHADRLARAMGVDVSALLPAKIEGLKPDNEGSK